MFCLNFISCYNIKIYTNFKNKNYFYNENIKNLNLSSQIKNKNTINKKYLNFLVKYNNTNYYTFNGVNKFLYKNFLFSIKFFLENNMKFIFISQNSKLIMPYYLNIFTKLDIYQNKNYLFYNQSYINYKNWLFFFKTFLIRYNIKVLFFLHFLNFSKFFKFYERLGLVKIIIADDLLVNPYFDYFFFCNKNDKQFLIFFTLNYFTSIFFYHVNNNKLVYKINFINNFKKISKKFLLIN